MNKLNIPKVILGGFAGTAAMTVLMLMAPFMGLPPMDIGKMIGSMLGGSTVLGWIMHFIIGTMLAGIYAAFFVQRIPGPTAIRGALYSILPWLVAQLVVMPMMGAGVFSGSAMAAMGSLVGHVVYGAIVGAIYGTNEYACDECAHTAHSHSNARA